ncbi:MAG: AraC family transcriptional regulator [Gammaproteobacteria bacterium]|nr:AraC family transcriptional regulator [Gammaproteobacteria bacterium]
MTQLIFVGSDKYSIQQYLPATNVHCDLTSYLDISETRLNQTDLILLSTMNTTGFSINWLREFKQHWSSLPVVVISDAFNTADPRLFFRAGALDYLVLPAEGEHLSSLITKFTNKIFDTQHSEEATIVVEKEFQPTNKAASYIQNNYHARLKVEKLADLCRMHPNTFARKFKEEQGVTVREFIKSQRINAAMQLLRKTRLTIENIAFNVGFETISLFNRLFKQVTGLSPSLYRQIAI